MNAGIDFDRPGFRMIASNFPRSFGQNFVLSNDWSHANCPDRPASRQRRFLMLSLNIFLECSEVESCEVVAYGKLKNDRNI